VKKIILAAAAVCAVSAPAFAGDLPVRRQTPYYAPPPAQQLFNWTGFYVGGHAGWGWGSALGSDPNGYLLGLQAGYNFQVASNILAGIETDISITGIDATNGANTVSLDYLGTVRGRLGAVMDRFYVYGTAGLAYGRGDMENAGLSNNQTHIGWTAGLGVEAFIAPNITARIEYLYADLGRETYQTIGGPVRTSIDTSIIRMGMNYKF
jgi:outer membrane immunogenic protein